MGHMHLLLVMGYVAEIAALVMVPWMKMNYGQIAPGHLEMHHALIS
jgi:hypothetical protein